jgi:hypothetical protein
MRWLSENDLKNAAEKYRAQFGGNIGDWTYMMALVAIAACVGRGRDDDFGPSWVLGNIAGYDPTLSDGYFRRERPDESTFFRRIDLAELLFNLQDVEGIDRVLDTLRDGTIESVVAELEAAKLLRLAGLPFRFVEPVGAKGSDFDVEIVVPGGYINCEIKCKLEATDLSDRTIVRTLAKASSQLPKDAANVIFVRLPTPWVWEAETGSAVMSAVRRFFGRSCRVAAIVFHWAVFIPLENNRTGRMTAFRVFPNYASGHWSMVVNELAAKLPSQSTSDSNSTVYSGNAPPAWRRLQDIAEELL